MTRIKRIDGSTWGRMYDVDGIKYPSVTSILNKWDAQALIQWAPSETARYIHDHLLECKPYELEHVLDDVCNLGKQRPNVVRDTAASRGTYLHGVLEAYLRGNSYEAALRDDPLIERMIASMEKWVEKWEFEPLTDADGKPLIETTVYSKTHGYAGTVDIIGVIEDDQLILIDFKTGKSTRRKDAGQVAAYAGAYAEMFGKWPDLACILHLLPSGNIKMKHVLDEAESKRAFEAFLGLVGWFNWDAER